MQNCALRFGQMPLVDALNTSAASRPGVANDAARPVAVRKSSSGKQLS
jgi:hypothetical protein